MKFLGLVAAVCGGVLLVVAIVFGLNELVFRANQRYMPLNEQNRANTFDNSVTYNEGVARDLSSMRLQYTATGETQDQKDIIRDTVRERYGHYDEARLPPTLAVFYDQMMSPN
jgi:hypothetical protein